MPLRLFFVLAVFAVGSGCGREEQRRAPAIGEAYVAPESLNLRKDIGLSSGVIGTVKRGERVEILQRRRRFVKVRTAAKQEGWTEQAQLLTPEVYNQIGDIAKKSLAVPSLGVYHARDKLNLHIEPYRWSPSFYQLREEEKLDLLGRQITERLQGPRPDPAKSSGSPPQSTATAPSAPDIAATPKAYDEWYLVRTIGEPVRAGWVLARLIDSNIPDEVAQYAEGQRITSYFSLAETVDGDQVKKTWLWTTIGRGTNLYDFDGFRVFNWGRRRHRYETAYRERNLEGYFPVSVTPKVETKYGTGPGFSIIIEKNSQRLIRRYVVLGPIVRRYEEQPVVSAPKLEPATEAPPEPKPAESPGLLRRLWNKLRRK